MAGMGWPSCLTSARHTAMNACASGERGGRWQQRRLRRCYQEDPLPASLVCMGHATVSLEERDRHKPYVQMARSADLTTARPCPFVTGSGPNMLARRWPSGAILLSSVVWCIRYGARLWQMDILAGSGCRAVSRRRWSLVWRSFTVLRYLPTANRSATGPWGRACLARHRPKGAGRDVEWEGMWLIPGPRA